MKDLNGNDRRDDLNVMDPFEALFTGIVIEDVPENDKNIIFKFIVSDGSYFYPVTHTCENVLTTGKLDFLSFGAYFIGIDDEVCNASVDFNDFLDCCCDVYLYLNGAYIFSDNVDFGVKHAFLEWLYEDDEYEGTKFDDIQFECDIVPDEVNTLFRELLTQYDLNEIPYVIHKKDEYNEGESLDDDIDIDEFLAQFDGIELL